jgi:hypothetical protein
MTGLPLDFDSLLAYLIPGLIALVGIGFLSPTLKQFLGTLRSQHSAGTLLLLALIALVTGMLLSDIRVGTLQRTCHFDLRWIPWISDERSFAPIQEEPVAYGKLLEQGRLNALQEAKRSEQTPYRFHGNTLLAVTVFVISRITALSRTPRSTISPRARARSIIAAVLLLLVAFAVLYPSFRTHYYNFKDAIRAINTVQPCDAANRLRCHAGCFHRHLATIMQPARQLRR